MIKLIFSDLDDTLLNSDNRISAANRAAIHAATERGIQFCAATGRMSASASLQMDALGLRCPLISCNGARVEDLRTGEVLVERHIPPEIARDVARFCEANRHYLQYYKGEKYYFAEECAYSRSYGQSTGVLGETAGKLSDFIQEPGEKLLLFVDPEANEAIRAELVALFGDALSITRSKPYFIELTHPEAQKGVAAALLAGRWGISSAESLAFGDGDNDISLIKWAGYGVAMANGTDSIKAAARYVAPDHDADGVAAGIYALAFGETERLHGREIT